jgi:hypothetical protein
MKRLFIICAFTFVIFVLFIGTLFGVYSLYFNRKAMPYAEETRRLTYGQSLSYQQGTERDFENLCLQYNQAKSQSTKTIIRYMTQRRVNDYVGPPVSPYIMDCLTKMGVIK